MKNGISFLTFLFLLHSSSASSPFSTTSYSHAKYNKLFSHSSPGSTDFCDVVKDIRITLLGQAWIQFPLSGTNLTYENVTGMINKLAGFKSTVILSNLETAINGTYAQTNGATIVNGDSPHVADPGVIDILKKNYSINILTTSNNHFADFGPNGTISGLDELSIRGVKNTGAGTDDNAARVPAVLHHQNGKRVGVLGIVGATQTQNTVGWMANATFPGVNGLPMINNGGGNFTPDPVVVQKNLDAITAGCQQNDLMIQYHHNHWNSTGAGLYNIAAWWQALAHQFIDAGTSLYLSQGNQNIRGIEIYNGALLIYSNGNLFFEGTVVANPEIQEGFIFDACFDGVSTKLKAARAIPTILTNGEGSWPSSSWNETHGLPELSNGAQATATLEKLQSLSASFGTVIDIDYDNLIGYVQVPPPTKPNSNLGCKRNGDLQKADTQTALKSNKNPVQVNKKVRFTATVSDSYHFDNPDGNVTFKDNGVVLATVDLHGKKAFYTTQSLTVGTHNITATYNGDNFYTSSTSSVLAQVVIQGGGGGNGGNGHEGGGKGHEGGGKGHKGKGK